MNKFEKNIKDAVENYEVLYSTEAWQSLNKAMGPSKATILKWIGSAVALIAIAIFCYTYFDESKSVELIEDNLITNTVQNNKSKAFIKRVENSVYDNKGKLMIETVEGKTKDETENTVSKVNSDNNLNNESDKNLTPINEPTFGTIDKVETLSINEVSTINGSDDNSNVDFEFKSIDFKAKVITSKTTQCISNEFTFTPSVAKQNAIYEWHLGDGTIKTGGYVNHIYENTGNYEVTLVLKDKKSQSIIKTSEALVINVLENPIADFKFEHIENSIIPETYFENASISEGIPNWEITGLYRSSLESFNYSFRKKGRYNIKLTLTNEAGCTNTQSQIIEISNDYNLLAPTAFSPDGDNLNDNFIPKALEVLELPFTLTIYDRQGKLVYQTSDVSQPWDGLYTQDGIPAPNGVYVWVCQLTNLDGKHDIYQSQVIITK